MGQKFDHIPAEIIEWIKTQDLFWVGTAPLSSSGRVNVSPKGVKGTFHVEGPNEVWYEDLSGSGCETMAHLRENGRITFQFCAFAGAPRILRLYGRGVAYEFGTPEYEAKVNPSGRLPGSRSIVCVAVDLVRTSCGWGIPIYSNQGTRKSIVGFASNLERNDVKAATAAEGKSKKGLKAFWSRFNQNSVDGLPAFDACINTEKRFSSHVPESLSSTFREIGKGGKTKTSESNIFALAKKHEAGSLLSLDENAKLFIGIVIGITLSSLFRAVIDVVKPSLVL